MRVNIPCTVLCCCLFVSSTSAQFPAYTVPDPLGEAGTQFIRYNATLTGVFTHAGPNLSHCGTNGAYDLDIDNNSPLYVGVNPPWDPNPFFFWFYRLNFRTAAYICYQDGEPCGRITNWPWYYVRAQLLNLSLASVETREGSPTGDGGGDMFYEVKGDQKSFVSNRTALDPALFFTAPGFPVNETRSSGQRDSQGCVLTESISWNATTPFHYTLKFSNTSASALIEVLAPEGNLTLHYTGIRANGPGLEPYNGVPTPISLASPKDHPVPHFTFSTGKELAFAQEGDGTWYAHSAAAAENRGVGSPGASALLVLCLTGIAMTLSF